MVILDVMDDHILAPEKYPDNFVLIYLLEVCQEWGGQEWGYIEDVEGSGWETWRTGSSLTKWMTLVDPKDHVLKVSGHYFHFLVKICFVQIKFSNQYYRKMIGNPDFI